MEEIKTKIETAENLRDAGLSEREEAEAVVSVCIYCIFIILHTTETAVEKMIEELRADKEHCTFKGYAQQLRAVEAELRQTHARNIFAQGDYRERLDIINRETHEYMAKPLEQMRLSVWNWGAKHGGHNPRMVSAVTTAQAVTFWAITGISKRLEEMEEYKEYGKNWGVFAAVKPEKLNKRLMQLVDRCAKMVGDDESKDHDINDCAELLTGLKILDNISTDIDLLSLHTAFALEETMGAEELKKHHIESYYRLHPNEDPRVIAEKKAKAEREAREAEERRKAFEAIEEAERKEKEREEAGAGAWAEELAEAWAGNVRK